MKSTKRDRLNRMYWIVLFFVFSLPGLQAADLTAGYDQTPPYHYHDQSGRIIGIDVDFLREVGEKAGVNMVFLERPWIRTLKEVERGELDIAIGAKYTEERARFAHYSVSYKSIDHWVYTRKGEYGRVSSIEDFFASPDSVLGVVRGWGYPPELANVVYDEKNSDSIILVNDVKLLPRMLEAGRVNGIVITPEMLAEIGIAENKTYDFSIRAKYEEKLHFLFSKKSVSLHVVKKCNKAIEELLKKGRLEELTQLYSNK